MTRRASVVEWSHKAATDPAWVATDLAILISTGLGVIVILLRDRILPPKFSYDSNKIQAMAQGSLSYDDDRSFAAVASVYRSVGLAGRPTLAAMLGFCIFVVIMIAMRVMLKSSAPDTVTPFIFAVSILLASVYLGAYSKDVFVLFVVCVAVFSRAGRRGFFTLSAAMAAYAIAFRSYWIIVLIAFVGIHAVLRSSRRIRWLALACATGFAALALGYQLIAGQSVSAIRVATNNSRIGAEDAATQIGVFVSGAAQVGEIANLALTFAALVVPLPLARLGTAYHIAVATALAAIWLYTASLILGGIRSGSFRRGAVACRVAALIVAFVITQAVFEPDYGSALRHATPLLPAIAYLSVAVMPRQRLIDRNAGLGDAGECERPRKSVAYPARKAVRVSGT